MSSQGLISHYCKSPWKAEWFEQKEDENLNIYVEGLPKTFTLEKFENLVKKYGIIKPDEKTGKPKIKLYTDKEVSWLRPRDFFAPIFGRNGFLPKNGAV